MSSRRAGCILGLVALLHVLVNLYWLRRDTRPWVWDMAFHARMGLDYLEWMQHPSIEGLRRAYQESLQYPPLYHWTEALSYATVGRFEDTAVFPNFFFLGLMLWAVFRIGTRVGGVDVGLWAALLASLFPMVVWLSRTPLLDFALTAVVCTAVHLLLETKNFSVRKNSILFGVACGLGMLVKWSFLFFLAGPTAFIYFGTRAQKNHARAANLLLAVMAMGMAASTWYAAKAHYLLMDFLPQHMAEGAAEGDPALFSPVSWLSYLQFLLSYQLFFPLAALLAAGVYWSFRRQPGSSSLAVIWVWLASSWLLLTVLRNKDPRYSVPLLPAVGLLAAAGFGGADRLRTQVRWATLAVAGLQFLAITFPLSVLPEKVSLGIFQRGTYTWEWQIFSNSYAGFLGPARDERWPIDSILSMVAGKGGRTLYVVPDHPYFSAEAFLFEARLYRRPVQIRPLRSVDFSVGPGDFIIIKSGSQGDLRTTADAERLSHNVKQDPSLRLLQTYPLPDRSQASLYGPKEAGSSLFGHR